MGLGTELTAKNVTTVFPTEVGKFHRLPTEIISDMDVKFLGEFVNLFARY